MNPKFWVLIVWLAGMVACLIWLPGIILRSRLRDTFQGEDGTSSFIPMSIFWPLVGSVSLGYFIYKLYMGHIERIKASATARVKAREKALGFTNGPYAQGGLVRTAPGTWTSSTGTTTIVGPEFVNVAFTATPTDPSAVVTEIRMSPEEYAALVSSAKEGEPKEKEDKEPEIVHKKSRYDFVKQPNNQKERG